MANVASTLIAAVKAKTTPTPVSTTPTPPTSTDLNNPMFVFLLSWMLWLVILSALQETRIGYVLLYYSLLLMILYVLVTYFATLGPLLRGITNIATLNIQTPPSTTPNTPVTPITPIIPITA